MDNTPESIKEEVSLERPLSPVLSTGKKSTLFKFGGKIRKKSSRTNLSKRFVQNEQEVVQGSSTRENVCLYFSDLPDPSDSPEIRLKKLQGMEDRRREYLKYLTEIQTGEQVFAASTKCTNDNFKKPLSPVVLKVKKECTSHQSSAIQERAGCSSDTFGQGSENYLLKNKKFDSLINIHENPVLAKSIIDEAADSQENTLLTDSQINNLVDDIESAASKEAGNIEAEEKNSYFKYVSKFLGKFEKERLKQYAKASNMSQTQAVSDLSIHCKNIIDLIDLVDKNSTSSSTVGTFKCPAFHGFDKNSIKLAKEKANCCNDIYENLQKDVIHDSDEEEMDLNICSPKIPVNQPVLIPQTESRLSNHDFITLYDNNERENKVLKETAEGRVFDKQKQTQEWFNSCFTETDFKKNISTSSMETNSDTVSETNSAKTYKSEKFVCRSPGFGFKCASGKQIKVSETALLNAAKIFDQVIEEVKCGEEKKHEQSNIETIHVNSKYSNNSVKDCMTSTTTTNKNFEDTETSSSASTHVLQVQSAPTVMFTSASGKSISISNTAFDKATQMFQELETDTKALQDNSSVETPLTGFKTAAGSGISVSAGALGAAKKLFVDVNQNQDDTVICKTPTNEKKPLRKHLGMSHRSKPIPIQQQNLENAKKMFEDICGDMRIESPLRTTITTAFSCHTPRRQQYDGSYISTPVCNSSPIFFDKFGCDVNRTVDKSKKEFSYKTMETNVVIRSATEGNVSKWLEEVNEERSKVEQQLNILVLKQQALQQQKMQLESENLKRYNILSIIHITRN